MSSKSVKITSGDGQVDQDPVNLSQGAGEEITWFSHLNQSAKVVFGPGNSPFQYSSFQIPAGGSVSSGPSIVTPDSKKTYKYTVTGPNGQNDPVVIIDP